MLDAYELGGWGRQDLPVPQKNTTRYTGRPGERNGGLDWDRISGASMLEHTSEFSAARLLVGTWNRAALNARALTRPHGQAHQADHNEE